MCSERILDLKDTCSKLPDIKLINGYCDDPGFSGGYEIVWPVVPKTSLTAIHFAQIKVIKSLLNEYGARSIAIMCSDFNCEKSAENYIRFTTDLKKCLVKNGIAQEKIRIEKIDFPYIIFDDLKYLFCEIEMYYMIKFKNKNFLQGNELDKDLNKDSGKKIQKYIHPLIQIAKIIRYMEGTSGDYLIVAGCDEKEQWSKLTEIFGKKTGVGRVGLMLIPELTNSGRTVDQSNSYISGVISCSSRHKLSEYLRENEDALNWFNKMFVQFPSPTIYDIRYDDIKMEEIWQLVKIYTEQ